MSEQLWVAEYSISQCAFHIQEASTMIKGNIKCIRHNKSHDYLIIGVFESREEASKCCNYFSKRLSGTPHTKEYERI